MLGRLRPSKPRPRLGARTPLSASVFVGHLHVTARTGLDCAWASPDVQAPNLVELWPFALHIGPFDHPGQAQRTRKKARLRKQGSQSAL